MLLLSEHERDLLLQIVRSWLTIDWNHVHSTQLLGGMSGATIARLMVQWPQTALAGNGASAHFPPGFGSTILKLGRQVMLDQERRAYMQIPTGYQHYFAGSLMEPHPIAVINEEAYGLLLIEDLVGYGTLQEALRTAEPFFIVGLTEQLLVFIGRVYKIPTNHADHHPLLNSLYINPIRHSLHKLAQSQHALLDFAEVAAAIQEQLHFIITRGERFLHFPRTVMHGDLNLHNIMLREARPEMGDIDFRLIDLDKFKLVGDCAYDLGELLVDIERLHADHTLPDAVLQMGWTVEEAFQQMAKQNQDWSFHARLSLAKARSLLKLIELSVQRVLPVDKPITPNGLGQQQSILIRTNLDKVYDFLTLAAAQL
jgi:Phosphotransferase enzyme family